MGIDAHDPEACLPADKLRVLADDREIRAGVIEHLASQVDVTVQIRRLKTGDYVIPGKVQFERKTVSDFALSIVDGRLFSQAVRMRSSGLPAVLILEGCQDPHMTQGVSRSALQGALITLSVVLGIPVLRSVSPEETATLIGYTARQLLRQSRNVVKRPGGRPQGKFRRQLFLLQGLPGVGPQRADALLERFGSVGGVLNADEDELASVAGIGAKTAGRITEIMN